jgi:hypothetical protein
MFASRRHWVLQIVSDNAWYWISWTSLFQYLWQSWQPWQLIDIWAFYILSNIESWWQKGSLRHFCFCIFVHNRVYCFVYFAESVILEGFHTFSIMFLFILLAIFVYTKIYIAIKTRKSPGNVQGNTAVKNQNERKFVTEIKLVKSCFLAVACFLLCFFAATVIFLFERQLERADYTALKMWAGTPTMLNSSLNSVIFFWTRPILRKEAYTKL